jgi:F-type H+/Na+-transporting ATPase subunit alpha
MPVEEQVVSLYAATNGSLDPVAVEDVRRFEEELLEWFRTRHSDMLDGIRSSGDIGDVEAFEAAINAFGEQFQHSGAGAEEPDAEAQGDEERAMVSERGLLPEEEITRDDETPDHTS